MAKKSLNRKHAIVGIIGTTGYGKTTFAKALVRDCKRLVVFDPQDDFDLFPVENLPDFVHVLYNPDFRIASRLDDTDEYLFAFKALNYFRDIDIIVDEANIWSNAYKNPPEFDQLIFRGRRRGLNLIWTSQRPGMVSRNLSSQTQWLIGFQLLEPRDIYYLSSSWRKRATELENLPKFEYRFLRGKESDLKEIYPF